MKAYIICCVPAQISYLANVSSWDMGQNVFSEWDCIIFLSTICPEQTNEVADFFHVNTNSDKLKVVASLVNGL